MAQNNATSAACSEAIQIKGAETFRHGFFDIEPYLTTSLQHLPSFADFFTTSLKLDPLNHIPALPAHYTREYNERRVMYLFNVPRAMTRERLRDVLDDFGIVEKLPSVTDLVSKETFRWVVMSRREEATRLHKMLRLVPVAECENGNMMAVTPCQPRRGLILEFHRDKKNFEARPKEDLLPIHGDKVEEMNDLGTVEEADDSQILRPTDAAASAFSLGPSAATFDFAETRAIDNLLFTCNQRDRNAFTNPYLESLYSGFVGGLGTPNYQSTNAVVQDPPPTELIDPLITLLRRTIAPRTSRSEDNPEASTTEPASLQRKGSGSKVAVSNIAGSVGAVKHDRTSSISFSVEIPTAEASKSTKTSLFHTTEQFAEGHTKGKGKATSQELEVEQSPLSINSLPTTKIASVSSWAAIANAGPSTKLIDIAPATSTNVNNRLRVLGRIPSGANPSKTEPLADQMRVVFILDIPTSLTYEDISNAVREGPIRSIHFGLDEEKNSRFAAVVFQHSKDALMFVKVLQKERVESRPERFRWVVDVVRGEEPFPLDDVLRAMQPPIFATRRLTLVKASLFFMVGERQLRARIERIVGGGTIQLIWLYNGGNATVVLSDVSSAMAVKEEFDRYSATAGKSDGAPLAWGGLQTTFSKDPCVQPLDLKTALHD